MRLMQGMIPVMRHARTNVDSHLEAKREANPNLKVVDSSDQGLKAHQKFRQLGLEPAICQQEGTASFAEFMAPTKLAAGLSETRKRRHRPDVSTTSERRAFPKRFSVFAACWSMLVCAFRGSLDLAGSKKRGSLAFRSL